MAPFIANKNEDDPILKYIRVFSLGNNTNNQSNRSS
jgi:hypothetical protein